MTSIEGVTEIISLIIAPVVLITACVSIFNGLIIRYNSIGDRIRTVNQEIIKLYLISLNLASKAFSFCYQTKEG